MTVSDAITKAFSHAQGKPTPPDVGSTKYRQLLILADSVQKDIANEPGIDWNWLYERQTVSGGLTDTFDLDDTVDYIVQDENDPILVGTTPYTLTNPRKLYQNRQNNYCAQIGATLVFSHVLTDSSDITVPTILKVDDITAPSDDVQIPSDMAFVYLLAAEFDQNDIVKVTRVGSLIEKANQALEKLKEKNDSAVDEVERGNFMDTMSWT